MFDTDSLASHNFDSFVSFATSKDLEDNIISLLNLNANESSHVLFKFAGLWVIDEKHYSDHQLQYKQYLRVSASKNKISFRLLNGFVS